MSGLTSLILISIIFWIWIFYEAWRAPMMDDNGRITKEGRKISDLFKKKK